MAWGAEEWEAWVQDQRAKGKDISREDRVERALAHTKSAQEEQIYKWRNTNKELQRIEEKRMLAQIEIDTQVAEFASSLQGVEPFDITGGM